MATLHKSFILIVLLTLLGCTASCHSSRSASKSEPTASRSTTETATGEWTNVYMPVNVTLERPMSLSMSGRATMVRDSVINISMRIFGMEVAVINLTSDSVWLVDKFHKYAFAESTQRVLGSHPMTISQIQNLILGADNGEATTLTFDNPRSDNPVTITFSGYTSTPAGELAQQVRVNAEVGARDVDAALNWQLNRAVWNNPDRKVSFSRPGRGYTWLSADDVMDMLRM